MAADERGIARKKARDRVSPPNPQMISAVFRGRISTFWPIEARRKRDY
jgi:hypothetical protein